METMVNLTETINQNYTLEGTSYLYLIYPIVWLTVGAPL